MIITILGAILGIGDIIDQVDFQRSQEQTQTSFHAFLDPVATDAGKLLTLQAGLTGTGVNDGSATAISEDIAELLVTMRARADERADLFPLFENLPTATSAPPTAIPSPSSLPTLSATPGGE